VLVSELNLQVMDGFPMALKAEMPRPDDARMHGTDGHLVDA
jgi:hypothetical protein